MNNDKSPRIEEPMREPTLEEQAARVKLPRSKSELKRLCLTALGVHARLWSRDGQIEVGLEKGANRVVLAKGPTPEIAWVAICEAARRAGAKERGEPVEEATTTDTTEPLP